MDPTTSRVYLSQNVAFDETWFPTKEKVTPSLPVSTFSSPSSKVLLPSYFFSINSITTAHTHDTTEPTAAPIPPSPIGSPPVLPPTLLQWTLVSPPNLPLSPPLPCNHLPPWPLLPLLLNPVTFPHWNLFPTILTGSLDHKQVLLNPKPSLIFTSTMPLSIIFKPLLPTSFLVSLPLIYRLLPIWSGLQQWPLNFRLLWTTEPGLCALGHLITP